MTEVRTWLRIAKECVRKGGCDDSFLCCEVNDLAPLGLHHQMRERLELFRPTGRRHGGVWWRYDGSTTLSELNDQRALACCFLAVMAEEDT